MTKEKTVKDINCELLLDTGDKVSLSIDSDEYESTWPELEAAVLRRGFFYADSLGCVATINGSSLSIINAGRIVGVLL